MNYLPRYLLFAMLCTYGIHSSAQEDTLSYADQFELLAAEMDSLSIFRLIDSVLSSTVEPYSELNIRTGYTSNVVSAGRNYGINQHGFSPGIAYYHKSGVFADLTGYWNSAFAPKYNLTLASIGYLGTIKNFSYLPSYEKWFYNNDSTATLSNSLGLSLNQDFKYVNVGLDYSFLFGKESAHRLIGSVSGYASLKNVWIFDRISFMPSVSILFGNDEITQIRFTEGNSTNFGGEEIYYISLLSKEEQQEWLRNEFLELRTNDYSAGRRKAKFTLLTTYQNNLETHDMILTPETQQYLEAKLFNEETNNIFGLMNWSFHIPVLFTIKKFTISLSYSYNIPKALPGEEFEFDPISYFGASMSYRIPFKK